MFRSIFNRHLLYLVFTTCFLFFINTKILYANTSYLDDFGNNSVSSSLWEYKRTDGINYNLDGIMDYASFRGHTSNSFPYLRSFNLGNIAPFTFEFRLYLNTKSTNQGSGIILSSILPPENFAPQFDSYLFYIWPKPNGKYYFFTPLCSQNNVLCNPTLQLSDGLIEMPAYRWFQMFIEYDGIKYKIYLDHKLVFESVQTSQVINYLAVGQPEVVGTESIWPEFDIDFVSINNPMSSPYPSSSLIPSPSPYPYFSQKDESWAKQIYDHAIKWAQSGKRGIDSWGCALTSVVMVLKENNIKTPKGEEITPAILNRWLQSQPDGYVKGGLLNWLAVTRYVNLSKKAGQSTTDLEFKKEMYSKGKVENYLSSNLDPILGIPGHFVVAYSNLPNDYVINDSYKGAGLKLPKSSSILTSNTFIPSQTDLSYMLFVHNENVELSVKDSDGNKVDYFTFDEYLSDDNDNTDSTHYKLTYVAKPKSGNYKIAIGNPNSSKEVVDSYLYDSNGKVVADQFVARESAVTEFSLNYNSHNINRSRFERRWNWWRIYWKNWVKAFSNLDK